MCYGKVRQSEQKTVVAIPELLFYYTAIYHQHIVTKIAAVKIRLGISQPHLLAVFHSFDLVMI